MSLYSKLLTNQLIAQAIQTVQVKNGDEYGQLDYQSMPGIVFIRM